MNQSNHELRRLNQVILLGFTAVSLSLLFWSVIRTDILGREDNPRLVEAEYRIQRGQILDRNGIVLAETSGPPERQQRHYPLPYIGPAIGYYSLQYGTSGVEKSYDAILRGDSDAFWPEFVRQSLHRPQIGQNVRLALDAALQATAVTHLNNHTGAIILLDITHDTADILVATSAPGYDPNQLDERFDDLVADENGPLLNRVTQGQYQPGLILQPIILAAALEQGIISLNDTVENANRPVPINDIGTRCNEPPPEPTTWADVLRYHCPGPMQELGEQLGVAGLGQIFNDFGLTTPPQLALDTGAPENEPLMDPHMAAIGQENLTVTPLQIGLALATLADNGRTHPPRLVTAVQDTNGAWQETAVQSDAQPPINRATRPIREALPHRQTISEYGRLVISGPEGSTNGWYLGLTADYVIVVVIEETDNLGLAETIGRAVMTAVLTNDKQ